MDLFLEWGPSDSTAALGSKLTWFCVGDRS